ncbi:hypothetical protein VTN00DRAFT_9163 [Thermoascus crustaceus]|uniref:uncharacterized protein n=1 Tax=Thermoascus crustaceus TaxID=5088 RepID=UPI003743382E
MASNSGRRKSLRLDLANASPLESPPGIAALFLIRFDIKTGYVIAWKRSLPDVELEGVVEYKSLPSGLHNVTEDLVYFVHDKYAGISAFVNKPAAESERNALMFAVGVLVPLSSGRLGKGWRHATGLKQLAQNLADDPSDTQPLVDYWETFHKARDYGSPTLIESPLESPSSLRSKSKGERPESFRHIRALSDVTALEMTKPALAPYHPALSLPEFIDSFGPLVFPLYRAALLRKRILLVTEAPVHLACNYVYDLSLLSSLPQSLLPLLPSEDLPPLRPLPLFNVGIHDIPYLSTLKNPPAGSEKNQSWIACSTDNVLTIKSDLYDILVTLPPPYSKNAPKKVYPKIIIVPPKSRNQKPPQPTQLQATQRDARRFLTLRDGLRQLSGKLVSEDPEPDDESDASSTFSSSSIVEPLSWPRLAYTSFIWWASAGEKRDGLTEEEEEQVEQDTRLLASMDSSTATLSERSQDLPEVALVAYFRRLTTQIFTTLSDAVARQDNADIDDDDDAADEGYRDEPAQEDNDDEEDDGVMVTRESTQQEDDPNTSLLPSGTKRGESDFPPVTITSADMTQMGLDLWSAADRLFVEELLDLWWGRKAHVDGTRIKCCGIPIL